MGRFIKKQVSKAGVRAIDTISDVRNISNDDAGWASPAFVSSAADASGRTVKQSTNSTEFGGRFDNINAKSLPFVKSGDYFSPATLIDLCEKAYWNFGIVKEILNSYVSILSGELVMLGGNKSSRVFVQKWLDRIKIGDVKRQYFDSQIRKGNAVIHRIDGVLNESDYENMKRSYGAKKREIPIKYFFLNPGCVRVPFLSSYNATSLYQVISGQEAYKILHGKDDTSAQIRKQWNAEQRRAAGLRQDVYIELQPDTTLFFPFRKLDDEPFGVPTLYPVLESVDYYFQLRAMERILASTIDWAMLLVTAGEAADAEGKKVTVSTKKALASLQELFQNQAARRTLIADYTTKAEWVIPEIQQLLGEEKYRQVMKEILMGLSATMFGDSEKFSSGSLKLKVWSKKATEDRKSFLDDFLNPEVKRVCESMGFREIPYFQFEDNNLDDPTVWLRIFTQLAQIGVLTPEETLNAIETGLLPSPEESLRSQREFKEHRDNGLYLPILNKPQEAAGRPNGTSAPQTTKNVSPVGTSQASLHGVSVKGLVASLKAFDAAKLKFETVARAKMQLKKLSGEQKRVLHEAALNLIANEGNEVSEDRIAAFLDNPNITLRPEIAIASEKIMHECEVDSQIAVLMACNLTKDTPNENQES